MSGYKQKNGREDQENHYVEMSRPGMIVLSIEDVMVRTEMEKELRKLRNPNPADRVIHGWKKQTLLSMNCGCIR